MTRAAQTVGGVEQLAKRLGFSHVMVRAWMAGSAKPPDDVFFKAVAILHGEEDAPKANDALDDGPSKEATPRS